jgi:hypothetical protein
LQAITPEENTAEMIERQTYLKEIRELKKRIQDLETDTEMIIEEAANNSRKQDRWFYKHRWGNSHDNERVICLDCECSPLGWEAKEPCQYG